MADISASTNRWNKALILCVCLFGVFCFFAGRFSIHQPIAGSGLKIATISDHRAINVKAATDLPSLISRNENSTNAAPDAFGWDEKKWNDLISQPGSPARNAALAAMLEKLGATDPVRAMAFAQAEGNLRVREDLVQASLHGWARTSPTNAANWALALADSNERERALSTVFAGAVAADPDEAVRLGKLVIAQNPDEAAGYGSRLIDALCANGNFDKAAQMAVSGEDQTRSDWMGEAYSKWAEFQPEQAADAAAAITDPQEKIQALHGIVGGWAEADPEGLVQFVMQLPADADRSSLLSQSLERWAKENPAEASQWINDSQPGPEFDQGIAAVATMDSLKPDIAIGWAESVLDPKLRSETLVTVLRNWATSDLPAAKQYFDSTQDLLPEDRQEVADVIAAISGQTAAQ
jgi:hypothetical protein